VKAKDSQGHTALQFAALLREVEIVRMLLEKGADVNAKDNSRSTALHWAIGTGKPRSVEVVRMLLEKGADVNAKNNVKHTALHDAVRNSNNVAMIRMLLEQGAEVNAKHLDIAREKGHTSVITLLEQTLAR
jgi:ankyrin repeat protein